MLLEYVDALQHLGDQLTDTAGGRGGRLLIVNGGLTSGKAELLQEFGALADRMGALCLTATAARGLQSLQADVVDQLFHSRGLPAETTEHVSRLLNPAVVAGQPESPDLENLSGAGAGAVRDTCAEVLRLSRAHPLVIGVDDVQFADAFSLQLLLYLSRRVESARIMIVLSKWDWAQPTLPRFYAEITRLPHGLIRLVPLSEHGIANLITQRTGEQPDPGLVAAYYELSGGNPKLVDALLEDQRTKAIETSGRSPSGLPAAGNHYQQAVLACLYRWNPQLLAVALALAVLEDEGSAGPLSRLSGLSVDTTEQVLHTLVAEALLNPGPTPGNYQFRHPAIPKTLLNSLPATERSRLHLQAAKLLHQQGVGARPVARHLTEAGVPVEGWAAGVLRAAAEQVLAHDDSGTAVEYLELAMNSCAPGTDHDSARMALAHASWRTSPAVSALHLSLLPEDPSPEALSRRDTATLVRHALWQGDVETAALGLKALERADGAVEDSTIACLRLTERWVYGPASEEWHRPDTRPEHSVEPTGGGSSSCAHAVRELAALSTRAGAEHAAAKARRVLENCALDDVSLETVVAAILALLHDGETESAVVWCDTLREEAARRLAPTWLGVLECLRAAIALRHGDLATAAKLARAGYERLPASAWGVFIGYPLSILMLVDTALGRHCAAAEHLRQVVPEAMYDTVWGAHYLRARGHHHLATDRALSAVSDFRAFGALAERLGLDFPALFPWRGDLALANMRLGRTVLAHRMLTEELEHPGLDLRAKGVTLRLLAACSDPSRRQSLLERAIDHLERSGDRLELSHALKAMSRVLQQCGQNEQARSTARRASQEARICRTGSEAPTEMESREPDAAVPGLRATASPESEQLSEAERKVATLAARGHTNREISSQLFITVSTVEQHLTRIYRKLGVTRRSDLPMHLADRRGALDGRPRS
ncbi:LuxR C-terminal-related transcriptional regulator [Streptomyces sp. NPDC050149]|uniref:LuxR C-terminal-related transcriptional regulator n=1 Tax=Streptomyces sp. NPDC050149 TaxID=3365603 RepID=UPI0037B288C0